MASIYKPFSVNALTKDDECFRELNRSKFSTTNFASHFYIKLLVIWEEIYNPILNFLELDRIKSHYAPRRAAFIAAQDYWRTSRMPMKSALIQGPALIR